MNILRLAIGFATVAALTGAAGAQAPAPPPKPPIVLQALAPNIYWAKEGSNVGVVVGDKGVVVYDAGGSAARAQELLAAIAKITPKPVDTVILSHSDGDHVMGLAGFPAGIKVIAHANTQKVLKAAFDAGKTPIPADRIPNQAVTGQQTLTLDGVKIQLLNWGPAHTDGDLVLFLPEQKIVFAGDIFCMDQARSFVKPDQGGSSEGWISTANAVVALNADRFVVGHGGVDTKATLRPFIDATKTERDQIVALVKQGKPLAEIRAAVNDPPGSATAPPNFKPYGQVVYEELTKK